MFWAVTTTSYVTTFWTTWGALRIWTISPVKIWPGNESTVNDARQADLDAADVGLVDVGVDLHLGQVLRDREQRGGLQAGRDGLPHVHGARDDDAVDGGADDRVLEVELGLAQSRLVLADLGDGRQELGLGDLEGRLRRAHAASWACSCALFASCWAIAES